MINIVQTELTRQNGLWYLSFNGFWPVKPSLHPLVRQHHLDQGKTQEYRPLRAEVSKNDV
jgi:hypothetical protein